MNTQNYKSSTELSARLRKARSIRGLSQAKLAYRCGEGITAQIISKYECGEKKNMWIGTLKKLAIGLDVSTDYLLGINDKITKRKIKS